MKLTRYTAPQTSIVQETQAERAAVLSPQDAAAAAAAPFEGVAKIAGEGARVAAVIDKVRTQADNAEDIVTMQAAEDNREEQTRLLWEKAESNDDITTEDINKGLDAIESQYLKTVDGLNRPENTSQYRSYSEQTAETRLNSRAAQIEKLRVGRSIKRFGAAYDNTLIQASEAPPGQRSAHYGKALNMLEVAMSDEGGSVPFVDAEKGRQEQVRIEKLIREDVMDGRVEDIYQVMLVDYESAQEMIKEVVNDYENQEERTLLLSKISTITAAVEKVNRENQTATDNDYTLKAQDMVAEGSVPTTAAEVINNRDNAIAAGVSESVALSVANQQLGYIASRESQVNELDQARSAYDQGVITSTKGGREQVDLLIRSGMDELEVITSTGVLPTLWYEQISAGTQSEKNIPEGYKLWKAVQETNSIRGLNIDDGLSGDSLAIMQGVDNRLPSDKIATPEEIQEAYASVLEYRNLSEEKRLQMVASYNLQKPDLLKTLQSGLKNDPLASQTGNVFFDVPVVEWAQPALLVSAETAMTRAATVGGVSDEESLLRIGQDAMMRQVGLSNINSDIAGWTDSDWQIVPNGLGRQYDLSPTGTEIRQAIEKNINGGGTFSVSKYGSEEGVEYKTVDADEVEFRFPLAAKDMYVTEIPGIEDSYSKEGYVVVELWTKGEKGTRIYEGEGVAQIPGVAYIPIGDIKKFDTKTEADKLVDEETQKLNVQTVMSQAARASRENSLYAVDAFSNVVIQDLDELRKTQKIVEMNEAAKQTEGQEETEEQGPPF